MNVLAFFAHPDDETMLSGGTLALLAQAGAQVHYLSATRGEGGEVGAPPLCSLEELGDVRENELRCAVSALGGSSLAFLGYEDPRIGPEDKLFAYTQPENLATLAAQVATMIQQLDIQALLSHGSNGEYGHPAHVLTHRAAQMAVESLHERALLFYTVSATFPEHPRPRLTNANDPAHLVLDITPVLEQKIQAALCHRTQHDLFIRRPSAEIGRRLEVREVVMHVESLHRVLPAVNGTVQDELAHLLAEHMVQRIQ